MCACRLLCHDTQILVAAANAAHRKYQELNGLIEDKEWKFQPLSFEALGGMDVACCMMIRCMAKQIGNEWSTRWQDVERRIRREISSTIMKGAAHMIMRCILDSEP